MLTRLGPVNINISINTRTGSKGSDYLHICYIAAALTGDCSAGQPNKKLLVLRVVILKG
jgi:hypothetical protein